MNYIKSSTYLFFIFFSSLTYSQTNSDDCLENLSIFAESAKIKNYESAYEPWKLVLDNCPKLNVATYQYGELILKDLIKKRIKKRPYMNYLWKALKKNNANEN